MLHVLLLFQATPIPPVYDMRVTLQPAESRMIVSGTVVIQGKGDGKPIEMRFLKKAADVRIGGIQLATPSREIKSDSVYQVAPISPRGPIKVQFSYTLDGKPENLYYVGPDVAYASAWGANWYPIVVGDSDRGTGNLRFNMPKDWTVVTGGDRMASRVGEASFKVPHPTYFSFSSGKYVRYARKGKVPIEIFSLTPRSNMDRYLEGLGKVVETLSGEFGAYPFPTFAVAEVPNERAAASSFNGASPQGFFLAQSKAFRSTEFKYPLPFLSHEAAHQWFPHKVAFSGDRGYFMIEALAQYGSLRCVEEMMGGEVGANNRLEGMDTFDKTYSITGYFGLLSKGKDEPLATPPMTDFGRELAYSKGSLVWSMLRDELGRNRFQKAFRSLTARHAFGELPWDQFTGELSAGAGTDLKWFFEQWCDRTGAPEVTLTWESGATDVKVIAQQGEPVYRMNLEIQFAGANGEKALRTMRLDSARKEARFALPFKVSDIKADPMNRLLCKLTVKAE